MVIPEKSGFPETRQLMLETAKHEEDPFLAQSVRTLGKYKEASAAPILMRVLDAKEPETRRLAVRSLAELEHFPGLQLARKHSDNRVREDAASALTSFGEAPSAESLLADLRQVDETMVVSAAEWLGARKEAAAVRPLTSLLTNKHRAVVVASLRALAKIGSKDAYDPVRANLVVWSLRKSAGEALIDAGWQPVSSQDRIHLWLSDFDWATRQIQWRPQEGEIDRILMADIQSDDFNRMQYAMFTVIKRADAEKVPALVERLKKRGSKDLAEAFLNCGHQPLREAAERWASANGLIVQTGSGSSPVHWGR